MQERENQKMMIDGAKLSKILEAKGVSLETLKKRVELNLGSDPSDVTAGKASNLKGISKTHLHRLAKVTEKTLIPAWRARAIAGALGVPNSEIRADTDIPRSTEPFTMGEIAFQKIECTSVTKGSQVSDQLAASDVNDLVILVEPEEEEAQDAILEFILLIEAPKPGGHYEQTKRRFGFNNIVRTLNENNLDLYVGQGKLVAPFELIFDDDENCTTRFYKWKHSSNPFGGDNPFDGLDLCDVTVLRIANATNTSLTTEHNMDPANIMEHTSDACIIENMTRLSQGEKYVTNSDFQNFDHQDFVSSRAREIHMKKKKKNKDGGFW